MQYLTESMCYQIAQHHPGGHWDCTPLSARWRYHKMAIDLIKGLGIDDSSHVLEMGTMGASLILGSHTIDYAEHWDFPGKRPTYLHDARKLPWPIGDKQYDLFVALRVYQHLAPYQEKCFREARRVARKVLIVVPDNYRNRLHTDSRGITYEQFLRWNAQTPPDVCIDTGMGYLYYWGEMRPAKKIYYTRVRKRQLRKTTRSSVSMSLKNATRRALMYVGLSIHRKRQPTALESQCAAASEASMGRKGFVVEFIGPSGVGKSRLYEMLIRSRHPDAVWYPNETARKFLPSGEGTSGLGEYHEVLELALDETCRMAVGIETKYELLRYRWKIVLQDMQIKASHMNLLLDEGLCQNFGAPLLEVASRNEAGFRALMRGKAVVHCICEPSEIARRVRLRESSGHLLGLHRGMDDAQLLAYSNEILSCKAEFVRCLRQCQLQTLTIDMRVNAEINVSKVNAFIEDCARSWNSEDGVWSPSGD